MDLGFYFQGFVEIQVLRDGPTVCAAKIDDH